MFLLSMTFKHVVRHQHVFHSLPQLSGRGQVEGRSLYIRYSPCILTYYISWGKRYIYCDKFLTKVFNYLHSGLYFKISQTFIITTETNRLPVVCILCPTECGDRNLPSECGRLHSPLPVRSVRN